MKLSYRWLGDMVDLSDTTSDQIQRLLTFHTCEIEDREDIGEHLGAIRTARVLDVQPHPDADRLRVCQVDAGEGAVEVVCGAPNVAAGQIVAFAPVGTTLTMPDGAELTLTARKVRGVVSNGMICAEDELGLGDDHDGILVLPEDTEVGQPFGAALKLCDTLFHIDNIGITHRPDLWGHVGFARELGAVLGRRPTLPSAPTRGELEAGADGEPYPVEVEDAADCPRYMGWVLDGLENGPSPLWLRRRLESLGVRSIDRIVDLTNYVLLEQGQPMHAFDLRDVRGDRIAVRRARDGESIKTLDEIDRPLTPDDLVIADGEGPVAVAGVMGGLGSGVRADTTSILLESACFDPIRVRRTASRIGLRTDASSRFEKGLDPNLAEMAARRFVVLAQEMMPDVRLVRPVADAYPNPPATRTIELPMNLVRRRLGMRIPDMVVKGKLGALGFRVEEVGPNLHVTIPSWRAGKDVEYAEDLVEEVGRIRGYDHVAPMTPVTPMRPRHPASRRALERRVGPILSVDLGYREVKNYSFYGPADVEALGIADLDHVMLSHAYTDRQDRLVRTTAANLLRTAQRNGLRAPQGAMWESSRVFVPDGDKPAHEEPVIAGVAWDTEAVEDRGAVFLNAVADVRSMLTRMGATDVRIEQGDAMAADSATPPRWLHPGRSARVSASGVPIGIVGEIAPAVRRAFEMEGRVAFFELRVRGLEEAVSKSSHKYEALLRYPVVPFDVSLLAGRRRPAQEIVDVIQDALPGNVRNVHCFDVYEGEGVPEGQRSLAFRCELFDREKTLSGKQADKMRNKVIEALTAAGVSVRGG